MKSATELRERIQYWRSVLVQELNHIGQGK